MVSVKKGILRCALVTETSETFQTAEIDQLGLLANLQALIGLSTDISEFAVTIMSREALVYCVPREHPEVVRVTRDAVYP